MKKSINKFFRQMMCICMAVLLSILTAGSVSAEDVTIDNAQTIDVDRSYSGRLADECTDYYKFVLGESGKITYTVSMDTSQGH